MDKTIFTKLKKAMVDYARINFFQYNDLGGNIPTGIFCTSSVFIKKDFAMEEVERIIKKNKYPYSVSEAGYELTRHFVIKL